MRRPWIPPAKPRRIPSTRPVTILDTPPADGGWEYRASYCGIPLQVFSQRPVSGNLLQAGETIIARYVPGAGQLWFPSPEANLQALYFTPGDYAPGVPPFHINGELWKLGLDGVPVKVWATPLDWEGITCVFWSQIDNQLYFATWIDASADPSGDTVVRVYRFNRSTNVATEICSYFNADDPDDTDPIVDAAEYGNNIYLHSAYWLYPYILRFDPIAGTVARVFVYPAFGYTGGIAIDPGVALVGFDGYRAYRSPTGDLGSWVLDFDLDAAFNSRDSLSLITHKGDSNYIYAGLDTNPIDDVIGRRTAPATWGIDLNHPDPNNDTAIVTFTIEYDSTGTIIALYAQFWNWWEISEGAHIYRKPVGGAWALDWVGPAAAAPLTGWVGVACQGLAQGPDGKIYGLWWEKHSHTRLYRRDGPGVWTVVQQWDLYNGVHDWFYTGIWAMTLAPNNLFKCHEV